MNSLANYQAVSAMLSLRMSAVACLMAPIRLFVAKKIESAKNIRDLVKHHAFGCPDIAASVTSARDGIPRLTRDSSTCVAQITGTWAASQIQRISS